MKYLELLPLCIPHTEPLWIEEWMEDTVHVCCSLHVNLYTVLTQHSQLAVVYIVFMVTCVCMYHCITSDTAYTRNSHNGKCMVYINLMMVMLVKLIRIALWLVLSICLLLAFCLSIVSLSLSASVCVCVHVCVRMCLCVYLK